MEDSFFPNQTNNQGQTSRNILSKLLTFFTSGKKGVIIMVIILISAVSGTIYLARTKPELLGIYTPKSEDNDGGVDEVQKLVDEVSKIIALPEGELPTIATVTDAELTREQPFFANAQNGDRVLIYQSAKKAYLYRPIEKRIIEVGVVNIEQQPEGAEGQTAGEQTENIILEEPSPTPELTETPTEEISPTPIVFPTSQATPTPEVTP